MNTAKKMFRTFLRFFKMHFSARRKVISEETRKLGGYLLAYSVLAPFIQPDKEGSFSLAFTVGCVIVILGICLTPSKDNKNQGG